MIGIGVAPAATQVADPWYALAFEVLRTAFFDLTRPGRRPPRFLPGRRVNPAWTDWMQATKARTDALDFLQRRLWEDGNLWALWLGARISRTMILREVAFRLGQARRCRACHGVGAQHSYEDEHERRDACTACHGTGYYRGQRP